MQKISISGALSSIGFSYFKDGRLSPVATIDPLVVDVNSDGVDELLFAGFESQPNTPANYDNVSMSLFGWLDGSFTNLTTQWLPNGADDIEGSGELVSGDFNGDGLTDIFISGNADMDHYTNAYVLMNKGDHFIKKSLGSTWWQHGADVTDINNDGYDDVFATGYNQGYAFYFGSETGLLEYKITDDWLGYGSGVALGNFLNNGQARRRYHFRRGRHRHFRHLKGRRLGDGFQHRRGQDRERRRLCRHHPDRDRRQFGADRQRWRHPHLAGGDDDAQ